MAITRITFCAALLLVGDHALAADDTAGWQFKIAPYIWLPTIAGDSNYRLPPSSGGSGTASVSVGPTDWLELLNMAALVSGSATKGRLTFFTDIVYLSLGKDDGGGVTSVDVEISGPGDRITIPVSADVNTAVESGLDGYYFNLAAGYSFHQSESSTHWVFGGVRRIDIDIDVDWNLTVDIVTPGNEVVMPAQGSVRRSRGYWDGIVGVRGSFALGASQWSVPYYVDIGTGDSELTWTAQLLLQRRYGWGDLAFGYRHLEYDDGDSGLLEGFSFSGPGIGVGFRF